MIVHWGCRIDRFKLAATASPGLWGLIVACGVATAPDEGANEQHHEDNQHRDGYLHAVWSNVKRNAKITMLVNPSVYAGG